MKMEEIDIKFNLETWKACDTSVETGYIRLKEEDNPLPNNTKYWQIVRALLYTAIVTRPLFSQQ